MKKNPKVDLKRKSKGVFEICLILALALHIVMFMAFKRFEVESLELESVDTVIEVQDIPETEQSRRPPPPAAPSIPVESEDEELLEDITIEDTDFDFNDFDELPPPPTPMEEEEEIPPFLPLEDQPVIIGGIGGIQSRVKYPEIALRAEIEGQVVIQVTISRAGLPTNPQIMKSLGDACDQAAIKAIMATKFTPAKQRDKPVPYPITIPVRFKIQ